VLIAFTASSAAGVDAASAVKAVAKRKALN